jgi:hypothetical protein
MVDAKDAIKAFAFNSHDSCSAPNAASTSIIEDLKITEGVRLVGKIVPFKVTDARSDREEERRFCES